MELRIALAGNPNCGKTTLFNVLTGSNQYVGNWPGVTVEKKEGKLKKQDGVIITDLPGIYSLSPYTMEEVVARNYLIGERPDAILNIIDGTNLERNLYLTTQLTELGIPVVLAINMMDVVRRNGDELDTETLAKKLGCKVVEISALKEDGVDEAVDAAIAAAKNSRHVPQHTFSGPVEHALAHIEEAAIHEMPEERQRWDAIKVFERDVRVLEQLGISEDTMKHIESDIAAAEKEMDDDAESIITNERYNYIGSIIDQCYKRRNKNRLSESDRIDSVVTGRWLGLPVFALIMFLVYFIAMKGPGAWATDWTNEHLFGDGFHLSGIGTSAYEEKAEEYRDASNAVRGFYDLDTGRDDFDAETALAEMEEVNGAEAAVVSVEDEETLKTSDMTVYFEKIPRNAGDDVINMSYKDAVEYFRENGFEEPDPAADGIFVRSIPDAVEGLLDKAGTAGWLKGLIIDGIVAGVGAVLGFVPQMFVLFLLLSFLEGCGYMSRIAFVLDRLFRRFGLSGKSFIPMLVGTGCGVPGIMASRTIENLQDRRMTIITTTFIPCGAKVPFIAMISGAVFGGSPLIAVSSYFIGMLAVIVSGVMLKKTSLFRGELSPFVMELPAYHMPPLKNVLHDTWDRSWSFIKKAGTVILLSTIIIWFFSRFGFTDSGFTMLNEGEFDKSVLGRIGSAVAWIFIPLGWGNWQSAVASITGLAAKENIVSTMGVLYSGGSGTVWQNLADRFTHVTAYSFLLFNLLCAPCVAAMGAIRREMNSAKWTFFAIAYQTVFAYSIAFMVTQFGWLFTGEGNTAGAVTAFAILAVMIYMMFVRKFDRTSSKKKTSAK